MREELITFETAKLAKEKGFNLRSEPYRYNSKGELTLLEGINAPTQSLLQKWLREVHNKEVFVVCTVKNDDTKGKYISNKFMIPFTQAFKVEDLRDTWEEAFEEGLQEALKLIKNENT